MSTDRTELFESLYRECQDDSDLLADVLDTLVNTASQSVLDQLEDLLVNNFGDD